MAADAPGLEREVLEAKAEEVFRFLYGLEGEALASLIDRIR
jgi:hypothetical protein